MKDEQEQPSFAALDALLDQALALDEQARDDFIAQLPEAQQQELRRLLELSAELTLSDFAAEAAGLLNVDAQAPDMPESTMAPSAGAGQWRLHRELGSGGMGQVFYATRETSSDADEANAQEANAQEANAQEASAQEANVQYVQQAAVKVLWSHRVEPEARARFFRERRILASLNHPGLARFVDGGFLADGRPWFAMEYIEGAGLIEHALALPIVQRLVLFEEICAAVTYAHERLVVHRDIKPQNVLVDTQGHARLLDFGVAGVLDDVDDGVHTRTQGGPLTLQYASPEQVTGQLVTVASDVYQLGLLLFEMLTGTAPYQLKQQALQEALSIICKVAPAPPSQSNADVDADLDAIVLTALRKDPSARYRSAVELAEDLQRFRTGRPVTAVPHSTWYVTRRFLRRHALLAVISAVSVIGLTATTLISVNMAEEARAQAQRSDSAQQILSDVFLRADPFSTSGGPVTLADALVKAQPDIEQRVAGDALLAWEVNQTLGKIYAGLGLVDEEIVAYRAVIAAAEQLPSHTNHRRLVGVAGVGSALARSNPQQAALYFERELRDPASDSESVSAWLSAQYAYVGALSRIRAQDRADAQTRRMAEVVALHKVEDPRTRGRLSQLLAGVARRAEDSVAEDQHWLDTLNFMRAANNPSALAVTLNNRAIHLGRTGRFEESEAAFTEAIDIYEAATHQDPTFASVLRTYAGLLFRTQRRAEAIAMTKRALTMLSADTQVYARFVAQANLAAFSFVAADPALTLQTIVTALPPALVAFDSEPDIPRRMLPIFAKLLMFGNSDKLAARSLGLADSCPIDAIERGLQPLEPSEEREVRNQVWQKLTALQEQLDDNSLTQEVLDQFIGFYQDQVPPFFDAWDRWRLLDGLMQLEPTFVLAATLRDEHASLKALRARTAEQIQQQHLNSVSVLSSQFMNSAINRSDCP